MKSRAAGNASTVAETLSWDALRDLARFRATRGRAISLYLDLDPSEVPTAGDAATRINSLLDEGEKTEATNREALSHDQREALKADFERIRRYFEEDFARDGVRAVAVFCDGPEDVWRPLELGEPVRDTVKVGEEFFVAPLVPLVARGQDAIVAVISREQGLLYRLRAGRLVELVDRSEEQPRRHDQGGWSQARYQRRIDNLAEEHLRTVAVELDRQARRLGWPPVVVACPEEKRSDFAALLSNEARGAIVGWLNAEAHAPRAELLELAAPVLEARHAEREAELVERWREEAGRHGRASSGWEETLEAASDARVDVLLYADGVVRAAWRCPKCGRLSARGGECPLDGTSMEERDDALDLAVHQTLTHGGTVWAVRHRHDLEPVKGIGALLRY